MQRLVLQLAGLLLLVAAPVLAGTYLDRFELPSGATYTGSETCIDCHDEEGDFCAHSPHAVERTLAVPGSGVSACEACHGPGSLHVDEEGDGFILGIEALGALGEAGRVDMCTQCHTSHRLDWLDGPHAGVGIACSECHADQVHFGGSTTPAAHYRNRSEFCLQCHAVQSSDFRLPFRHRVLEGEIACDDCHDPHAGFAAAGWNGLNEVCLGCHTEMAGPFVFEHEGVAGEDCVGCHRPHGSMHDKLLSTDSSTLCLQCHFESTFDPIDAWSLGDAPHGGFLGGEARCYDCHTEIHGSNVSPAFRD